MKNVVYRTTAVKNGFMVEKTWETDTEKTTDGWSEAGYEKEFLVFLTWDDVVKFMSDNALVIV